MMPIFPMVSRLALRVLLPFALVYAFAGRVRRAWRNRPAARRTARAREVLPSLYDLHPEASVAFRRARGLEPVPLEQIVGTARHPSQNTADFLPLPQLRGRNWLARWQRIRRATDRLAVLPPVELLRYGDEYFVVDGHNRIAAALAVGAAAVDADVTELVPAGQEARGTPPISIAASVLGGDELRHAVSGRQSRTAEHRPVSDEVSRRNLLRTSGENARAAHEETDEHPIVQSAAGDAGDARDERHIEREAAAEDGRTA